MTDDPLRDLFGASAPNPDPLADLFGNAPNTDFITGIQPHHTPLGDALSGGVAPKAPVLPTKPSDFTASPVHPSRHDAERVKALEEQQAQEDYDNESWGEYAGDKLKSAAAGAVSVVGMGVRGLGAGLDRTRNLLSHALGSDPQKVDGFLRHWLPQVSSAFPAAGLLNPTFSSGLNEVGGEVQNVSDAINVSPERQQQVGNIVANATGQLAGLIAVSAVGGANAVNAAMLGQSFDQIDQSLKEKGEKGTSVSGDIATLVGGPVMAVLEKTGLDAVLEGVPLKIKSRILRGLADTMLVGGYEGAEEIAQQIVQNFAVKLGIDPNTPVRDWPKDLGEGVVPSAEGGFGAGFIARAVLGRWGAHGPVHHEQTGVGEPAPLGMREAGALSPDITPEDEASPLPTDLIVQGKMTMGASAGTTKANQVLRASGIPDVGTRVEVSHNGRTQHGAVADAWTVNVAGQDSVGVKIRLDDGTMIEEPVATLADMGVSIKPVTLPSGLPEQDLANPVVEQFAGEGMKAVEAATTEDPLAMFQRSTPYEAETSIEVNGKKVSGKTTIPAGKTSIPQDVVQGLVKAGIPEHVARGVAAGVVAESGNREGAINDASGATGLGQWLGSRKQALIDRYGPNPTRAQQIEFLIHELKGGDAGGASVLAAKNEDEALQAYITKFMRPAAGHETTSDLERGRAALGAKPGTQGDMFGGPQRTGTEMDAKAAVDRAAEDEETDKTDLLDTAHAVLTSEAASDDRYVDYHGQQLGNLLGTTVTPAEAPDYARAVLERFGNETHGHAVEGPTIRDLAPGYKAFGSHTGTLDIPRDQMPQIKAEHRGAMVNFLNARGIAHEEVTLPAHALKPSQAEFSPAKVQQAKEFTGGDRAILIDESNHVVDGHHQYVAAHDRGQEVRAIRLDAPVQKIADELKEMPSAETARDASSGESPQPENNSNGWVDGPTNQVRVARHEAGSNFLDPKADVGAITYTVRSGPNDRSPLPMVVNKDGKVVPRDQVLNSDNSSNGSAWVPPSEEAAQRVIGLLHERAQTRPASPERKAVDAKIAEAVRGTAPSKQDAMKAKMAERGGGPRVLVNHVGPDGKTDAERGRPLSEEERAAHRAENAKEEHPGLVIKSLRTGEETTIQPVGTKPTTPKQEALKAKQKGGSKRAEKEAAAAAEKERADKHLAEVRAENARRDAGKIAEWAHVDFTKSGAPLPNWNDRRVVMKRWVVGEPDYSRARKPGESYDDQDVEGQLKAMLDNEGLAVSWGQETVYRLEPTDKGWTVYVNHDMSRPNSHTFFEGMGLTREQAVDRMFQEPELAAHIGIQQGRDKPFDLRIFKDPEGRYYYRSDINYHNGGGTGPSGGDWYMADRFNTLEEAKADAVDKIWNRWRRIADSAEHTDNKKDLATWKKVQDVLLNNMPGGKRDVELDKADMQKELDEKLSSLNFHVFGNHATPLPRNLLNINFRDMPWRNNWEPGEKFAKPDWMTYSDPPSIASYQESARRTYQRYVDRFGEEPKLPERLEKPGEQKDTAPTKSWFDYLKEHQDEGVLPQSAANMRGESKPTVPVAPDDAPEPPPVDTPPPSKETETSPTKTGEAEAGAKTASAKPTGYGASNKIFTAEAADKARALIRDKLRNQLNSGFDPELMAAGLQLAGFHVEAGARQFAEFAKALADDLGVELARLKPYLGAWYLGTRAALDGMGQDVTDMDEPERVRAALSKIADSGKEEAENADQVGASERPQGQEPAAVQSTEPQRDAGRVGAGEAATGERDLRAPDRSGGEATERGSPRSEPQGSSRGASEGGRSGRPDGRSAAGSTGQNFVIEPGALDESRGPKQKARDNLEAIRLVKALAVEDRFATPEEQAQIAKYVGWGGLKNVFPDPISGKYGKGFEDVGAELAELLTPEEYETARRSIQYAHFTAEKVVRQMWAAAQRLGFDGGQVFEPGMGTGNFPGMMPDALRGAAHYQGVEMDGVTAAIAKALYPKHGVTQADFTAFEPSKDAYPLVIGNPPFSETVVKADPAYRSLGLVLHDYFFAKSLDAVQPGGALLFVTSAGTMNKISTEAREYMAERAWLAGAIRLPSTAFAENAGTEVTTDIVVLVKKVPGEERPSWAFPDHWTKTGIVDLPNKEGGKTQGHVNHYFLEHPEMVLGEQGFYDKLYPERYGVRADGRDLAKALAEAVDRLPADVLKSGTNLSQVRASTADFDVGEAKNGSYYLKDGELYQKQGGIGRKIETKSKGSKTGLTEQAQAIVRDLIPIRDQLRAVYNWDLKAAQSKDPTFAEGRAKAEREALNEAYDAFVSKYGPINKGIFTARRPNRVQIESARRRAREEARAQGHEWDDGTFDPSDLFDSGASVADVARIRADMKAEYAAQGQAWSDGTFTDEEVPDTIIEKRPNIDPFKEDPENYRLRSIENYYDETGTATKGRVFFESVIAREEEPDIKNATDALFHVLNKSGRVDLEEIARLAGTSPADAAADLAGQVFLNPETKGWEHSTVYLAGNVRQKLETARKALASDPRYQANVDALEAAMPPELGKSDVRAVLGMPWIPESDIEQFVSEELGLTSFKASYQPRLATWAVSGDRASAASTSTFGTTRRNAVELMGDSLNGSTPKVFDTFKNPDGTTYSVLNTQETQAAQDKQAQIKQKFEDWIYRDDDRAERLLKIYNERFNSFVAPEWDGSYLTTPGVTSSWNWRPHQKRGIARIIQSGNTYLGHAVGAGKTATMIAANMEMRRLGLLSKPMIAVPNHMLGQFTKEFYELYPLAKLAIADEENFHTDKRKQFVSDVALNDLDAVIITHSAFGLIPMSQEFERRFLMDQLSELRSILSEVKASDEDQQTKNITRRKVEQQIEQAEQRMRAVTTRRRDQTFTFEQMGVDFVNVDEAHLFRKLDFATKRGNIKGIDPKGSMRSMDLYMKTRYLEQRRPERSHVLASGTPITNTMAELYTISRYLQPDELIARGIDRFDAWAAAFGNTKSELEPTAGGTYKMQTRFSEFVNVPELSVMVRQVMDVVTSSQLEQYVVRPKVKRELILVPQTDGQSDYQQQLAARMDAIEKRRGKPEKGDDIILTVIGDGRKSAIDMRLVNPEHMTEPTKLERLIGNVFDVWQETKKHPFYEIKPDGYSAQPASHGAAAQMVFSSLGVSDAMEFNVHRYIRNELVKRGVPKDQIVLFNQIKTTVAKQKVFNDTNAGKVRILIGSVDKMGTGVNAQRRLYANHNLDPEWLPSSDEQRNGRIIRQGNTNREIRIFDYATKGTYDEQMWGIMARKARFIEGFFRGDPTLRTIEDLGEASTYEQAKALVAKDPRILELAQAQLELEKEIRRRNAHDQEQATAKRKAVYLKSEAEAERARLALEEADAGKVESIKGDAFKAVLNGKTFDDRQEFQAALDEAEKSDTLKRGINRVGTIGGFDLALILSHSERVSFDSEDGTAQKVREVTPALLLANDPQAVEARYVGLSTANTAVSAQAALDKLTRRPEDTRFRIAQLEKQQGEFEERAASITEYEGLPKIRELQTTVTRLTNELANENAKAEEAKRQQPMSQAAGPRHVVELSPSDVERIRNRLLQRMAELGINDRVSLEAAYGLGLHRSDTLGQYDTWNKLISIALHKTRTPEHSLNHEAIHALRDLGLFTSEEWSVLVDAAWSDPELRHWATASAAYRDLPLELQQEEAAAEFFAETVEAFNGKAVKGEPLGPFEGMLHRMIYRVVKFLNALRHAVSYLRTGLPGDTRLIDVITRINSGEVGRRRPLVRGKTPTTTFGKRIIERKAQAEEAARGGGEEPRGGLFPAGVEERWNDAAKGVGDGGSMLTKMTLSASRIGQALSRHWIDLPNVPKYAELQQELRKLEAAPQAAKERAVRHLRQVLKGLTREDMDLFTRKVVTDDLAWEADSDHELPFGFTPETLAEARKAIDAELATKPAVLDAVRKRKALNRSIAQDLVDSGVLDAERLKNPNYYRHVVLDYARAEAAAARVAGVGKKLRSPRWARRMGSEKDINANYLEAEFDWLAKALVDIPTARAISWIGDSEHNLLPSLREQAKAHNKAAMQNLLDHERQTVGEDGPIAEALKGFKQRIAMGFNFVEDALESSHIEIPPQLQPSYDALGTGKGDPFPFLSWLLDNNQPGANGAAVILKAISQRRVFEARVLGRNYIDPTDAEGLVKRLAPDGYTTWSPDDARLLFTVKTMPEHAIDAMLEKIDAAPGIKGDDVRAMLESVRSALAFGGMRYSMILPTEVASTLNQLRREDTRGLFDALAEEPLKRWKQWVLINPRRVLKYNLNNLSGDLDAVIAGRGPFNGKFWSQVGHAAYELATVMSGRAEPSARYEEAVERGVFDSGLSVQEIPDINRLSAFSNLTEGAGLRPDRVARKVLRKAWGALRGGTQWRENVLRYAAYLEYVHRLEAGEDMLKVGYGGSLPKMVDAINDPRDRAALLARDLLGDYAGVSHAGQEIRRKLIPFWSWMEVNAKRYWRLSSNAFAQGTMQGVATGGLLGAGVAVRTTMWLTIRMGLLYGLMQLWNHWLWPDEEKDLGKEQAQQLHLIVGRSDDGSVQTIRLQGALSDALSWFGLSDAADAMHNYELGRGPWYDVLLAPPKATINKLGTALSPLFTIPFETISGKKLFPDLFATRFIRDKWRNAFQTFSLENEYDWLMGKPSRGYAQSWVQGVVYSRDPGETAYNEARGITYDWLKRVKGQTDPGGYQSNRATALYSWRAARKFGDAEAEGKALQRLEELGVTSGDLKRSIKAADPLGPIAKKDRKAFLSQLTDDELATFEKAEGWYRQRFLEGPAQ